MGVPIWRDGLCRFRCVASVGGSQSARADIRNRTFRGIAWLASSAFFIDADQRIRSSFSLSSIRRFQWRPITFPHRIEILITEFSTKPVRTSETKCHRWCPRTVWRNDQVAICSYPVCSILLSQTNCLCNTYLMYALVNSVPSIK